jgi:hypothetical protein
MQIVVAVDRDAANSAGLLTSATVTTRLAEQLMSNIGASYNDGSLFIDQRTGISLIRFVLFLFSFVYTDTLQHRYCCLTASRVNCQHQERL